MYGYSMHRYAQFFLILCSQMLGDHLCAVRNGPKRTESMIPQGEDKGDPSLQATDLPRIFHGSSTLTFFGCENKRANLSDLLELLELCAEGSADALSL